MKNAAADRDATLDVIIPTRNRNRQLTATLTALARQTEQQFGVVVVDDGGTTSASRAAAEVADRLDVRFVRNAESIGPGPSRNRGVRESDADYIVFLDDDCIASRDLIRRHRSALAAAGGPAVSLGPILAPSCRRLSVWTHWDADRLEREYARIERGERSPDWTHLYTGNAAVRRQDFLAVGGFDGRFARQEDVELGFRLARMGCRFGFDPSAVVWHDSDRSLRTWSRVPAASAQFDVLMDRLVPDSQRLVTVQTSLADKHWAVRLTRRMAQPTMANRWAVSGAIGAGRALHALRAERTAMSALSVVWDLTYIDALRKELASERKVGSPS